MKAIVTKRHGLHRIRATVERTNVIVDRPDNALDDIAEHALAAIKMARKFNWHGRLVPGHWGNDVIVWNWDTERAIDV